MNNFKLKIKHLILMILISSISFALISYSLSLIFVNEVKIINQEMEKDKCDYSFVVSSKNDYPRYDISQEIISEMEENNIKLYPVIDEMWNFQNCFVIQNSIDFYGFLELDESIANDIGVELLYGRYPENYDEIAINIKLYELFLEKGHIDAPSGKVHDFDDLYGRRLYDKKKNKIFEIVGVIDTNVFDGEYHGYARYYGDSKNWSRDNLLFVCKGFFEETNKNYINQMAFKSIELSMCDYTRKLERSDVGNFTDTREKSSLIDNISKCENYYFFDETKNTLDDNEVIIDLDLIINGNTSSAIYEDYFSSVELQERFPKFNDYYCYICDELDEEAIVKHKEYIRKGKLMALGDNLENGVLIGIKIFVINYLIPNYDFKIVGFCENTQGMLFVNETTSNKIRDDIGGYDFQKAIVHHSNETHKVIRSNGLKYVNNYLIKIINTKLNLKFFIIILGLVSFILLIISVLLLVNYLSIIFGEFKNSNLILRSLGVKKSNILNIFRFQGLFVAVSITSASIGIFFVMQVIFRPLLIKILNNEKFDYSRFGIIQLLCIIFLTIIPIILSIKKIKKSDYNLREEELFKCD